MTPDPDLYGPPDRGNEDDEQDDDWEVLLEWAPPPEEATDDSIRITYGPGGTLFIASDCLTPDSCICGPDRRPDCPQQPHSDMGEEATDADS